MSNTFHDELPGYARLFWMAAGPMLLAMLTLGIVSHGNGWTTPIDAAFFGIVALMIVCRRLEFRDGVAHTSTGEPATLAHWRRYTFGLIAVSAATWLVANLLGNHWLDR